MSVLEATPAPPNAATELSDSCRLGDVQEGDLIFANRGFWLQRLCDLAGDPWLHVGMAAVVDGELSIVEVGPDGCGSRPLADITGNYRMMGVGRLPMVRSQCDCRYRVIDWARGQVGQPMVYAWDELNWAGFGALFSRILAPTAVSPSVLPAAAERLARKYKGRDVGHLFCSSFISAALEQSCDACRPDIEPFTVASTIADRMASGGTQPAAKPHSDLVKRVFTTPTDFWRGADTQRSVLLDCPNQMAVAVT